MNEQTISRKKINCERREQSMKRLMASIILFGSILFMGCTLAPEYTLIIKNESSHKVDFTMTIGYSDHEITLTAGDEYTHPNSIPKALKDKEKMKSYEPKDSVKYNCYGDIYIFTDIPIEPIPEPDPIPTSPSP